MVMRKLSLAHSMGWIGAFAAGLKGLGRLIRGRKTRTAFEAREQRVFEEDAKKEFETLNKKGLRIPLL